MFGNWDSDGDGLVSREEFQTRQRLGGAGRGGPGAGGADQQ
jgi:hypothetical protein